MLDHLEPLLNGLGKRPMVLLSKSQMGALRGQLERSLGALAEHAHFELFPGECTARAIAVAAQAGRDKGCDLIVGIGGGKTIDAAKGAQILLNVPLAIVPSIASNDAPTSRLAEAAPALPVGMAALVTLGLIVVIAGFVAIGIAAGIAPLYAGFLILWYFGSVDNLETKSLPALFVGALAGLGTSWLIQYGAGHWGPTGALPGLIIIIIAIFFQLAGWLPLVINRAYMLYVTVLGAATLQLHEDFGQVAIAIVAGTVYFGGIVFLGKRIAAKRAS